MIPAGEGQVTSLVGPPGVGKSRLLIGLAVAIAGELGEFLGQACSTGPVVILSGEDGPDFYLRGVKAWSSFFGLDASEIASLITVHHLPSVVVEGLPSTLTIGARSGTILNVPLLDGIIRSCNGAGAGFERHMAWDATDEPLRGQPPALIIVETASTLGAGDESNPSMRAFVQSLAHIARNVDGNPGLVATHHTPKEEGRKEKPLDLYSGRGGGAFTANARAALTLGAEGASRTLTLRCARLRDARGAVSMPLTFQPVIVDGAETAVLIPIGGVAPRRTNGATPPPPRERERPGTADRRALLAILALVSDYSLTRSTLSTDPTVTQYVGRDRARVIIRAAIEQGYLAEGPPTQGGRSVITTNTTEKLAERLAAANFEVGG